MLRQDKLCRLCGAAKSAAKPQPREARSHLCDSPCSTQARPSSDAYGMLFGVAVSGIGRNDVADPAERPARPDP